jgi:spermidine synthase
MIRRELLGTAHVPGGETLELYRHDRDFMIVMGNNELMSTRKQGSEEALATMTFERLGPGGQRHFLIGGYGMGFTLRAALRVLPADALVTVVELVPEIIEWARGPMAEVMAGCLDDPRVTLIEADVGQFISGAEGEYDAILLDVDNGPDGLVRAENDGLYSKHGLREARRALVDGGILAIWSAAPDPVFARRLQHARFSVEERRVAARSNGKGPKHIIWFAQR